MPDVVERLEPLYFKEGERVGGNILLHRDLRFKILKNVRDLSVAEGLTFGCCREGLERLNTAVCDGSGLLPKVSGDV
jgi:hypothetical protein